MMTTASYDFQQLNISGEGLVAQGTATLESAYADDSEFFVAEIVLTGGQRLTRPSRINSSDPVGGFLFTEIVKQIEDNRTTHGRLAELEWTDAVAGNAPEVPMFKRRAGLSRVMAYVDAGPPVRIPELKYTGSISPQAAE